MDYIRKNDRDLKVHERKDAIDNRWRMPISSLRLLTKGTNKLYKVRCCF